MARAVGVLLRDCACIQLMCVCVVSFGAPQGIHDRAFAILDKWKWVWVRYGSGAESESQGQGQGLGSDLCVYLALCEPAHHCPGLDSSARALTVLCHSHLFDHEPGRPVEVVEGLGHFEGRLERL
eukprot:scaffold421_cov58-Phaeocystis_antarctica.AAC.1